MLSERVLKMRYNLVIVKRIPQTFFSLASALSLLLLIATITLWIRSYFVRDQIGWFDGKEFSPTYVYSRRIVSADGGIMFQAEYQEWGKWAGKMFQGHAFVWSHEARGVYPVYEPSGPPDTPKFTRLAGAGFEIIIPGARPAYPYFEEAKSVTAPYWAIMIMTAILPLFWFRARQRNKLRCAVRFGFCLTCGYDLRATPDRCPECGTSAR